MTKKRAGGGNGGGELVIGSHKLKDWKGALPVGTIKMLTAFTAWHNEQRGLTGDAAVTEGDVVASIIQSVIGGNDDFMRHFEQQSSNGAGPASTAAGASKAPAK